MSEQHSNGVMETIFLVESRMAADLLRSLRARGAQVWRDGERVCCAPESVMTDWDRKAMYALQPYLMGALTVEEATKGGAHG